MDPRGFTDVASRETPDGEDVSTTVVLVVEELTGTPMEKLPLLERKLDIDALNSLFEPRGVGDPDSADGTLQFEYADCTVTVDSEGRVTARRPLQGQLDDRHLKEETRET